jgi:hypothetical protein
MVKTRSQSRDLPQDENEIDILKRQVSDLTKENEQLIKQLQILCSEYDELKRGKTEGKRTRRKKQNRFTQTVNVPKDTPLYESDTCDQDRKNTLDLLEILFRDEIENSKQNVSSVTEPTTSLHSTESRKLKDTNLPQNKRSHPRVKSDCADRPRTIVIGTSMVRDIHLSQTKLDSLIYCYPGQHISFLQSRVKHIMKDENPSFVVLQCGGNDLQRFQNCDTIKQYESLIMTVKSYAPAATIILGAVPPRGSNIAFQERIAKFNTYLHNRSKQSDNVEFFAQCPTRYDHFKQDQTHFNQDGARFYSIKLLSLIEYLHSFPRLSPRSVT